MVARAVVVLVAKLADQQVAIGARERAPTGALGLPNRLWTITVALVWLARAGAAPVGRGHGLFHAIAMHDFAGVWRMLVRHDGGFRGREALTLFVASSVESACRGSNQSAGWGAGPASAHMRPKV